MLTLIYPSESWLHRVPAGPKLAALPLLSVALLAFDSVAVSAGAGLAVAALALSCGRGFALRALASLRPVAIFVVLVLAWGWIDGTPENGLRIALRLLTLVGAALLVTMSTRFDAMMEAVARPLRRLKIVDAARLAFVAMLVLRFVPAMIARLGALQDSWRARSSRRAGWRLVMPFMIGALDDADHVTDAIRARGGMPTDRAGDDDTQG